MSAEHTIKKMLDRLVKAGGLSNDDCEAEFDEVLVAAHSLPRTGIMEALEKAIGKSKGRKKASAFVLAEWTDLPEAVERLREMLREPDPAIRGFLVEQIGQRPIRSLAELLNVVMENDPDDDVRGRAVHSAGTLKEKANLPTVLRLAEVDSPGTRSKVLWALKEYATKECGPFLMREYSRRRDSSNVWGATQEREEKVIAAWGLGKLGDKKAIAYLDEMLDDQDVHLPNGYCPGVSIRAAQSLADIFGWNFEWHKSSVDDIRRRFRESKKKKK